MRKKAFQPADAAGPADDARMQPDCHHARLARAFGMRVQYYDIVRMTEDAEDALGVRFRLMGELLTISDIVTLHVPLNTKTRHIIGAHELASMKPEAIIVNTSRGPVIDFPALHAALTGRRITVVEFAPVLS